VGKTAAWDESRQVMAAPEQGGSWM